MRWDRGHESPDVIDWRGRAAGGGMNAGLIFLLFRFASRFGCGGLVLAALFVGALLFLQSGPPADPAPVGQAPPADEQAQFVSFVLDDAQQTWEQTLPGYRRAQLVLFSGSTPTACGYGAAATGPFYCPTDQRVYIDLSFYDELAQRFGAPGDFAQAYVIAHEIGHHIQHQMGLTERVARSESAQGADGASVRLELQADCLAGVWARSADQRGILDVGDLEEGLRAAAAIGDDRLQRQQTGTVQPDSFTHGTSEQRQRWLRRGYEAGTVESCDTFDDAPRQL